MLSEILKLLREGGPAPFSVLIIFLIASLAARFVLSLVVVRRARPEDLPKIVVALTKWFKK